MSSIIQVYMDINRQNIFAQIMSERGFETRKQESEELTKLFGMKLDYIFEGTEKVYHSDLEFRRTADRFSKIIAVPNYSKRKSFDINPLVNELGTYGFSFCFVPEFYEELNHNLVDKLGFHEGK